MTPIGAWEKVKVWYKRLPPSYARRGRALTQEEKEHLFTVAARKGRWQVACCCAVVTANTTAGAGEIRHLRLGDVEIKEVTEDGKRILVGSIHIREGIKNPYRHGRIPLNADALPAVQKLIQRAHRLGSVRQEDYLLPARVTGGYDPAKPQGDWRGAWESLRLAAGMPDLRYNELRHTAITGILENPSVSDQTAMAIAGHISKDNFKVYSHTRQSQMENAVNGLSVGLTKKKNPNVINISRPSAPQIEDTCHATQSLPGNSLPPSSATSPVFEASTYSYVNTRPKKLLLSGTN